MNRPIILLLIWCLIFQPVLLRAESVDDRASQISPKHMPGAGEFMHGTGYGKILMRVLLFGAVPQQGIHYVPEGTDLLFCVLYSGGYNDETKLNSITIRRRGVKDLIVVDLEDLIEDGTSIPKLADGDIITVPFNWRRDISTIAIFTGFITSMTGFALALLANRKQ